MKSESEVAQSGSTLQPHGLQPTRLLRPWDFPDKSTGVGCHRRLCPDYVRGHLPDTVADFQMTSTASPSSFCGYFKRKFKNMLLY